jgi:hypothetical protein
LREREKIGRGKRREKIVKRVKQTEEREERRKRKRETQIEGPHLRYLRQKCHDDACGDARLHFSSYSLRSKKGKICIARSVLIFVYINRYC